MNRNRFRLTSAAKLNLKKLATVVGLLAVSALSNARPISPVSDEDYLPVDAAKAKLGQMLFFDKELSGNRNISCSTCHHPLAGTSDGLSINLGEGARGISVNRDPGSYPPAPSDPIDRGARNAPALFDLGANDFKFLMHDGRFGHDPDSGYFFTPAGDDLPAGFEHLLEVISIFAFTDVQEMLGQPGENDVADAAYAQNSPFTAVWNKLVERIRAVPAYEPLVLDAYPELNDLSELSIVHVGRAIAHFQTHAFSTSPDNPVDRFLKGERTAISQEAKKGYQLFVGKAGCVQCHNGPFLTDQSFHAIGVPQIGPGFNGVGHAGREDFGLEGVTGNPVDRYKFRTPPLRNVALTGPWGHDGAFSSLEDMVRHHLDPFTSLRNYDISQAILPSRADLDEIDKVCVSEPVVNDSIASRVMLEPVYLSEREFEHLMSFLYALTDPSAYNLRKFVPRRVPSGNTLSD
jgi:cytochrome c peroxidase